MAKSRDRGSAKRTDEELTPVFIPALGVILVAAEDKKGSPLTEAEVIRIRDESPVIMMTIGDAKKIDEGRGRDIDPENCWHDWQSLRNALGRKPSLAAGPRFNRVRDDDRELVQTVADAQATLQQFRDLIAASAKTGAATMVKTRLVDGKNSALMWLSNVEVTRRGFKGELFEVPSNFARYEVGDLVAVTPAKVLDWMVIDRGFLYGGYSIRLFRERKPIDERAEYDEYIGIREYAPLGKVAAAPKKTRRK